MGVCPNCGSWVDDGDVCTNCGGSASYSSDSSESENYQPSNRTKKAKRLSDKAWRLENEGMFEDALDLINQAIDINPHDANHFNRKAIILQDMRQYDYALDSYDRALSVKSDGTIRANKADCILSKLEAKRFRAKFTYRDLDLINEALKTLPQRENNYHYLQMKGKILENLGEPVKAKICYRLSGKLFDEVDEAERQLKFIKNSKDTFIIIAGTKFYENPKIPEGAILNLIKEPENVHDSNAIRVELNGETIGYVANSPRTLIKEVRSATDIRNLSFTKAEFLFELLETYKIARLIKSQ